MRIVLPWMMLAACGEAPQSPVEAGIAVQVEPVSAEIYVRSGGRAGDAVLYWPTLPAARPIGVRPGPADADQPWTDPIPTGDEIRRVVVWVDPTDLEELRHRVAQAGAPNVAPSSLVELEARSFPGMALGAAQLTWEISDAQMQGTTTTFVEVVRIVNDRVTLAVNPGEEASLVGLVSPRVMPRDQDRTDEEVALDAVVGSDIAVGSAVRLVWPEGTEVRDDVADGGYLYLGPDARGWARIGTLRYEKHLVTLRTEVGVPPLLVPDERTAFVVPLDRTPDPSRMTQTTHLTDGRLRSTDYPYAAVGERSITVLVPADDVGWLNHWLAVSGGRLKLARIRMIDRSGFDPPPPGFPANTRLRR
ncbi:MAG: hypothetical protein ABMB14_29015 [Myxococcota bacterium]